MFSPTPIRFLLIGLFLLLTNQLMAQIDSIGLPEDLEYQVESYIENIGEEEDFDFNTLYETLNTLLQKPLNLNQADASQLESI